MKNVKPLKKILAGTSLLALMLFAILPAQASEEADAKARAALPPFEEGFKIHHAAGAKLHTLDARTTATAAEQNRTENILGQAYRAYDSAKATHLAAEKELDVARQEAIRTEIAFGQGGSREAYERAYTAYSQLENLMPSTAAEQNRTEIDLGEAALAYEAARDAHRAAEEELEAARQEHMRTEIALGTDYAPPIEKEISLADKQKIAELMRSIALSL